MYNRRTWLFVSKWGKIFGIQRTSGNLIIDRETGKYQVLPWAYPAEEFYKIIDSMK